MTIKDLPFVQGVARYIFPCHELGPLVFFESRLSASACATTHPKMAKALDCRRTEISRIIAKFYRKFFSTRKMQKVNDFLLYLALRARGYDNYENMQISGEMHFIKNILAPFDPKLCIDIGANIGNYSKNLLEATHSNVISFEPLPQSFFELSQYLKPFESRLILENRAVGSTNGPKAILFSDEALSHASFKEEINQIDYVRNESTTIVQMVTLDSYCLEKKISIIDFIKIDVEGYEIEVLLGAKETISKIRPKFIQIEFNLHQLYIGVSLRQIAALLPDYSVYQLLENDWIERSASDFLSNIYLFSNFVFVRK
jgi:FkbM family methyltransferase